MFGDDLGICFFRIERVTRIGNLSVGDRDRYDFLGVDHRRISTLVDDPTEFWVITDELDGHKFRLPCIGGFDITRCIESEAPWRAIHPEPKVLTVESHLPKRHQDLPPNMTLEPTGDTRGLAALVRVRSRRLSAGRSTYGECDLVLAEGPSSVTTEEVTSHLLTNLWVVGHFVDREVRVEGALGERGRLTVM